MYLLFLTLDIDIFKYNLTLDINNILLVSADVGESLSLHNYSIISVGIFDQLFTNPLFFFIEYFRHFALKAKWEITFRLTGCLLTIAES